MSVSKRQFLKICELVVFVLAAFCTPAGLSNSNLLPLVNQADGKYYWTQVKTAETRAEFSMDFDICRGKETSSLKISSESRAGYAEWRVEPLLSLPPEQEYTFLVWVKNRSVGRPYFEAYSYNRGDEPKRIGDGYGRAGNNDWRRICSVFKVPADSQKIRISVGLGGCEGEAWFSQPMLLKGRQTDDSIGTQPQSSATEVPKIKRTEPVWTAEWLWIKDDPGVPKAVFQKTIQITDQPVNAILQITADNAYKLRVNGQSAGLDSDWWSVELIDATRLFQKGENMVEVEVLNYDGPGGFILQGEIQLPDGNCQTIISDKSWEVKVPDFKGSPQLWVIGKPPLPPWGIIPLQSFTPPEIVKLPVVDIPEKVRAGEVLRMIFVPLETMAASEVQRLQLTFFAGGKKRVLSGYPLRAALDGDRKLTVELPISSYAVPGTYRWQLQGIGCRLIAGNGKDSFVLEPGIPPFSYKPVRWPRKATNLMQTPAGPQAPFNYYTALPSVNSFMRWQTTGGHHYEVPAYMGGLWLNPDQWDIVPVERELMQILEADPLASVYLVVRVDMPLWWLLKNPDETFLSNKGRHGLQSFCSDIWRQDAVAGIKLLMDELKARPVGRCLAGVLISGFRGGEFQLWGEDVAEYDCCPAAKKAFAEWQKQRGVPENAQIQLPHPALAYPFEPGDQNAQARRQFFEFVADRHGGNIVYLAREIKKALGPEMGVSAYYGYIMEHASGLNRFLFAGHLGVYRVIREAPLDALSGIASYSLRGEGKAQAFMNPADSAVLHGITPLIEDDIRNYLTPYASDSAGHILKDLKRTLLSMQKVRMLAAAHGAAVRYMALLDCVDFFQDPPVLAEIQRLNQLVMKLKPAVMGQDGQIAFVLDPPAFCGAAELPEAEKMISTFVSQSRDVLQRTGRSVVYILMDDWLERRKLWETVVVPLPALLSPETRKALADTFGELPPIKPSDGILVLSRKPSKQIFTCSDLNELRERLATDSARAAGVKTAWYIGENFTARYNNESVEIHLNDKK